MLGNMCAQKYSGIQRNRKQDYPKGIKVSAPGTKENISGRNFRYHSDAIHAKYDIEKKIIK